MDDGKETRRINSVRDLEVYKLAFESAMEIFEISKSFPKEEIYSLTVETGFKPVSTQDQYALILQKAGENVDIRLYLLIN